MSYSQRISSIHKYGYPLKNEISGIFFTNFGNLPDRYLLRFLWNPLAFRGKFAYHASRIPYFPIGPT
jgi:hypothetical protein